MSAKEQIATMRIVRTALKRIENDGLSDEEREKLSRQMGKWLNEEIERRAGEFWQFAAVPRAMHDCETFGVGIVRTGPFN